ncbi:metal-dependent phosphohydrolase [Mycobacterium talmoniae]|uniref:Metal-dependent phosphohydrolase n=1 Tax=Mycobacterium talmoniae TaxID=1858794 RepID=A0A1S1N412_9MYCO|nr:MULTISPECIES: metal-dependent phosphohydrolase [Mycobacterium]OHU93366.1 metal-dependent phosphohydrolase [Mycobacterium talmoniae]
MPPSDPDVADLAAAWHALIAPQSTSPDRDGIGRGLLAAWSEPHRRYHNLAHLRDVLAHVDALAAHADDPDAVRLAAWYHDAVYRGRGDDEENSARRAETELAALGLPVSLIAEVARLVRLTAAHDPAPDDRNGVTLSDADLAILGAPADRYAAYAAAVRDEYAHLPDDAFRTGRAQVLRALLGGPALYRTPAAQQRWEAQARINLAAELDRLTG